MNKYVNKYYETCLKLAGLRIGYESTRFRNCWIFMAEESYKHGGRAPVRDAKTDWDVSDNPRCGM